MGKRYDQFEIDERHELYRLQEADIAVLAIEPHIQGYAKPWFSV